MCINSIFINFFICTLSFSDHTKTTQITNTKNKSTTAFPVLWNLFPKRGFFGKNSFSLEIYTIARPIRTRRGYKFNSFLFQSFFHTKMLVARKLFMSVLKKFLICFLYQQVALVLDAFFHYENNNKKKNSQQNAK